MALEAALLDRAQTIKKLEQELVRRERMVHELVASLEEAHQDAAPTPGPASAPALAIPDGEDLARENGDLRTKLDEVTERTAAPVIAKYTGVLAAADIEIFTRTTSFAIMQSLRLDRGPSAPVHP